jgi:hypothetical protein
MLAPQCGQTVLSETRIFPRSILRRWGILEKTIFVYFPLFP